MDPEPKHYSSHSGQSRERDFLLRTCSDATQVKPRLVGLAGSDVSMDERTDDVCWTSSMFETTCSSAAPQVAGFGKEATPCFQLPQGLYDCLKGFHFRPRGSTSGVAENVLHRDVFALDSWAVLSIDGSPTMSTGTLKSGGSSLTC